jgi:WD40 repeat protein
MIEVIDTYINPKGICAVSPSKEVCVLACPDKKTGTVRILHFDKGNKVVMIDAHQSSIGALTLNSEGTLIATASDKVYHFTKESFGFY